VPIAERFFVTQSTSERALPFAELAGIVRSEGATDVESFASFADALEGARDWAAAKPRRAVLVTGSITLVGEAIALAATRKWKP
jgi:dihydrofolate synthase / folylpolyglutamate synthase